MSRLGMSFKASLFHAVLSVLVLSSLFLRPGCLHAAGPAIVKVLVNTEDKGEYFIHLTPEGDVLLLREDFPGLGFRGAPEGSALTVGERTYLSLGSLAPAVTFELDERESALRLTADPGLLEKSVVDLSYARPSDVFYTEDTAAFFNYSLGYSMGDDFDFTTMNIPLEAGVSVGGFLGYSSFSYTKTDFDENFIRLFSNITTDDRTSLRRVVLGDFSAFSGILGSGGAFGGLSISKNFSLQPYFVRSPRLDLSGVLETPSKVDLYVNGLLTESQRFPAGEFEFLNLQRTGSGDVVLVVEDAFGRAERTVVPFYLSSQLLQPGLHDYSYNLGFAREEFGLESSQYGDLAFLGFHRFGFSERFTAGLRAEADRDLVNAGPTVTFVPWRLGETNLSIAVSSEDSRSGYGGFLSHSYIGRNISGGVTLRGFSREFASLGLFSFQDKPEFAWAANLGYNLRRYGSVSATYSKVDFHERTSERLSSLFYTKQLVSNVSLHLRVSRVEADETVDEVFLGLSFYLGNRKSGSLTYEVRDNLATETVNFQKDPPLGEGFGYRFLLDRSENEQGGSDTGGDGSLRYQGPFGIYSAGYRRVAETDNYDLKASGGVVFIDKGLYFTRPVTDSFALVKVGDLKGVEVSYSNQEVGDTNRDGEVIVPDLIAYYYNDLSFEAEDVPVNYEIAETRKYVSSPVRGGSIVRFDITKLQGFIGHAFFVEKGEKKAAEYGGLRIWIAEKTMEVVVGRGGKFYLENIPAGIYPAMLFSQDKECRFDIVFPESEEIMVDMGEVVCETE
jgi:outer membrane usher protein